MNNFSHIFRANIYQHICLLFIGTFIGLIGTLAAMLLINLINAKQIFIQTEIFTLAIMATPLFNLFIQKRTIIQSSHPLDIFISEQGITGPTKTRDRITIPFKEIDIESLLTLTQTSKQKKIGLFKKVTVKSLKNSQEILISTSFFMNIQIHDMAELISHKLQSIRQMHPQVV
jgi:hypothetical protein